jgi:hypothetical protein
MLIAACWCDFAVIAKAWIFAKKTQTTCRRNLVIVESPAKPNSLWTSQPVTSHKEDTLAEEGAISLKVGFIAANRR